MQIDGASGDERCCLIVNAAFSYSQGKGEERGERLQHPSQQSLCVGCPEKCGFYWEICPGGDLLSEEIDSLRKEVRCSQLSLGGFSNGVWSSRGRQPGSLELQ